MGGRCVVRARMAVDPSVMPEGTDIVAVLDKNDVRIATVYDSGMQVSVILLSWFHVALIGIWIFFMRQMQGGSRGAMGFGEVAGRVVNGASGSVTLRMLLASRGKKLNEDIVEFLKDPGKFQRLGGKSLKGFCLFTRNGKTLLARAIAGEAMFRFLPSQVPILLMFVGVGASRVRDMFEQGKTLHVSFLLTKLTQSGVIVVPVLEAAMTSVNKLNQMFIEMDGFEANEGVILIAATNRPDVLDPALRSGRLTVRWLCLI